jgi:fructose-1,6-bisphosphatase/inositol monophosphatase family enzyme
MSLTEDHLTELLEVAKLASLKAGQIISKVQGQKIKTDRKEGGTSLASQVVTEVDKKAEDKILEILNPTLEKYDLGLLTEERPDDQSRFKKDYFWCIDPLDGTLPFSQNKPGYSSSIALVSREGHALLGVVYDPRKENLYYALNGGGAFKNNQDFSFKVKRGEETIIDGPGGAVIQALETIERAPCLFYKRPKEELGGGCLWDYAATSVIHREAGGEHSDFFGRPLDLNNRDSVYMNHCGVIFSTGLSKDQVNRLISKRNQY